ncbi:MAG: hypothetical protein QNJ44_22930 [Rhodobacter sp.]|nr:hypothetical protein [Rhodobacter sp.]
MAGPTDVREEFDRLFAEWEERIRDPKIQASSRPKDYVEVEQYRAIVDLGKDALPLVLEKIADGVFLMNQAALEISGMDEEEIVARERKLPQKDRTGFAAEDIPRFLSEQQKSELIIRHLK